MNDWIRIIFYVLAGIFFFQASVILLLNSIAQSRFKQITGRHYTGRHIVSPVTPLLFGIGALIAALAFGGRG